MSLDMSILLVMLGSETNCDVFVESWAPQYGSPYRVEREDEDTDAPAMLVEDDALQAHDGRDDDSFARLAFVDGVRRVEASLYRLVDGQYVRGIAGAFACGCVEIDPLRGARFGQTVVDRIVVWGSGASQALPQTPGGWVWTAVSVPGDEAQAPLEALQARMRLAEGRLAGTIATDGTLAVADGPLNFSLRSHRAIVGYVKTHRRALLAPADHARVATLGAGQRSSLFRIGDDRYSCYLRLSDGLQSGPWGGMTRLEFGAALGIDAAVGSPTRSPSGCRNLPALHIAIRVLRKICCRSARSRTIYVANLDRKRLPSEPCTKRFARSMRGAQRDRLCRRLETRYDAKIRTRSRRRRGRATRRSGVDATHARRRHR